MAKNFRKMVLVDFDDYANKNVSQVNDHEVFDISGKIPSKQANTQTPTYIKNIDDKILYVEKKMNFLLKNKKLDDREKFYRFSGLLKKHSDLVNLKKIKIESENVKFIEKVIDLWPQMRQNVAGVDVNDEDIDQTLKIPKNNAFSIKKSIQKVPIPPHSSASSQLRGRNLLNDISSGTEEYFDTNEDDKVDESEIDDDEKASQLLATPNNVKSIKRIYNTPLPSNNKKKFKSIVSAHGIIKNWALRPTERRIKKWNAKKIEKMKNLQMFHNFTETN